MIDFIKELFCGHKWKILDSYEITVYHMLTMDEKRQKYVLQCEKCGKIKYKIV